MAKQTNKNYEEIRDAGRINARIIDARSGLQTVHDIYAVRIHSKGFRALIMNDYLPTIGRVNGSVTLLNNEGEHHYEQIRGFYKHQHNEFTLLIEEYLKEGAV